MSNSIELSGKVIEVGNLENTDGAVGVLLETDTGKHVAVIGVLPEQLRELDVSFYGRRENVTVGLAV